MLDHNPATNTSATKNAKQELAVSDNSVVQAGEDGKHGSRDRNTLRSRIWRIINWVPPRCRWDATNPPKFTLALNLLFGFVSRSLTSLYLLGMSFLTRSVHELVWSGFTVCACSRPACYKIVRSCVLRAPITPAQILLVSGGTDIEQQATRVFHRCLAWLAGHGHGHGICEYSNMLTNTIIGCNVHSCKSVL